MIDEYFHHIEKTILSFESIESYDLIKKKLNSSFGIIKGMLFYQNSRLEFLEVVRISDQGNVQKKKYKYHFQDHNSELIFRYDNVPHHPQIKSFPHHKHLENRIIDSDEPELMDVLFEIDMIIQAS